MPLSITLGIAQAGVSPGLPEPSSSNPVNLPRVNSRQPGGFTLIELLVVIAIIALLATIGVTVGQKTIIKTRELQAKSVMKGLEAAIRGYQTEYLRLPTSETPSPTTDNDAYDTTGENGKALLEVLLAKDAPHNPKGTHFWDGVPAKASSGAGYSAQDGLRDPWGSNGYRVVLDYGGNRAIANPYAGGPDAEADELNTIVIIYCAGANKTFEDEGSGGGKKPDDLKSWQH
jgi:prepilin-type N-terminal cleavage/methylation domain-containing protein